MVDIPDPIYRRLKAEAAIKGGSVKDLVLSGVIAKRDCAKPGATPRNPHLLALNPSLDTTPERPTQVFV